MAAKFCVHAARVVVLNFFFFFFFGSFLCGLHVSLRLLCGNEMLSAEGSDPKIEKKYLST